MSQNLTNRQAARIAGCSHTAIADAKKSGHLPTLSDGNVTREAVEKWNTERRAPRGGKHRKLATQLAGKKLPVVLISNDADIPEKALAALTKEGVFKDRATAELYRDSYVARLRQIEYEREAGKVIEVEHVARIVGESLARVRTRLLAIPAEQAPGLHRLKTVTELQAGLLECITEALTELVEATAFEGEIA